MLRHGPSFALRHSAKTTTLASRRTVLLIVTTTKSAEKFLSSLNLLRVNNRGHMSDDVINKEKVISETGNDLLGKPNSQARCI